MTSPVGSQVAQWAAGVLQGDSGGPVVWYMPRARRHLLVGVISVGIGCGADHPGINTKVAPYVRWILANR